MKMISAVYSSFISLVQTALRDRGGGLLMNAAFSIAFSRVDAHKKGDEKRSLKTIYIVLDFLCPFYVSV